MKDEEMVRMLLHDGCFIIKHLYNFVQGYNEEELYATRWSPAQLRIDLGMLENQIPFFVLEEILYHLTPRKLQRKITRDVGDDGMTDHAADLPAQDDDAAEEEAQAAVNTQLVATRTSRMKQLEIYLGNKASPKIQFFAWFLAKERLPTRHNLTKNCIVDTATCELCKMADENAAHLCPMAMHFWQAIGIRPSIIAKCRLAALTLRTRISTCFWNHRRNVVFGNLSPSLHVY
ncbi:hypothetical protein OsI_18316 [Oryza sativa Indica Group]|uniref:Reverse transcriptase zinc-binding domain-containing protein n=1 Tax=Oryza sativa subsp. indica TaxID=39946 RepID=A2Y011_ORYSI|nr:hypothetical protein OsI_18316 [Oryza sativa Indica Group]